MSLQNKNRMIVARRIIIGLALCAALSLSACQGVKRELGVGRNSPDEFMVVKRAPLTLPPDYELRAPDSNELMPASEVSAQAKDALLGKSATPVAAGSAENALMAKMGTDMANPDIRNVINRENGYIALENQHIADKLIFWKDPESVKENAIPTSQVNAAEEAARIRKNKEEGKPVNEGDVPVVEKKQSTVDKIFGSSSDEQ